MQKLSHEKIEKLIEWVQKHPILYDKAHPKYKFVSTKQKLWQEIGKELEISEENAQKAWRSLRDQYVRARNDRRGGPSQPGSTKKSYKYFEVLQFLEEPLGPKLSRSTNELKPVIEFDDDSLPTTSSPFVDPLQENISFELPPLSPSPPPRLKATKPIPSSVMPDEDKEFFQSLVKGKEDEISKFFSSISDTVRKCKLSNGEWITFQLDILASAQQSLGMMGKLN